MTLEDILLHTQWASVRASQTIRYIRRGIDRALALIASFAYARNTLPGEIDDYVLCEPNATELERNPFLPEISVTVGRQTLMSYRSKAKFRPNFKFLLRLPVWEYLLPSGLYRSPWQDKHIG